MSFRFVPLRAFLTKPSTGTISGASLFVPKSQQVRHLTPFGHVPTDNFSWKGMKKHYAVLPLVIIMAGAVSGVVGFSIYASQTRENVIFKKSSKTHTEKMDMLNPKPLKMRVINQKYSPIPEVNTAYKAMYGDQIEDKAE